MKLRTGVKAFKIVTEDRESVVQLFLKYQAAKDDTFDVIIDVLKKRKVFKTYKKDSIISAAKEAPPILCFRSYKDAKHWIDSYSYALKNTFIIQVIGYKEELIKLMRFNLERWQDFVKTGKISSINSCISPKGSIGFRRVKVMT